MISIYDSMCVLLVILAVPYIQANDEKLTPPVLQPDGLYVMSPYRVPYFHLPWMESGLWLQCVDSLIHLALTWRSHARVVAPY